jgi:DNA-binding transcriptional MocR family regulator
MGIALAVSDVVVSSGCMDAIRIAIASVTKPGDVVAVESPFLRLSAAPVRRGSASSEVGQPTTGIDLDLLERSLRRPRSVRRW